jgi:hypothetical protein
MKKFNVCYSLLNNLVVREQMKWPSHKLLKIGDTRGHCTVVSCFICNLLCLFLRGGGLPLLPWLALNSKAQAILQSQPPKELGLQVCATMHDYICFPFLWCWGSNPGPHMC